MKRILLIPILLISTLFFSIAQPISTFAPVGAEWWFQAHQYTDELTFFKESKAHQYISMEEVEYKGQLCRRLDVFEHIVDSTGVAHKTKLPDEYVYNNDDTVFYFNNKYNRFVPLYIFNVNPGDTLTFYIPNAVFDTLFRLIVDSVFYLDINGQTLQKVVLKQIECPHISYRDCPLEFVFDAYSPPRSPFGGSYVEKIGTKRSSFISPNRRENRTAMGHHKDPEIFCYKDSSFTVVYNYKDTPVNEDCFYPGKLSIDNLSLLGEKILVYPNPASEVVQLKLPDGIAIPNEIKVFDFTGKTVQTITSSGTNQFSVQNLPQGIYTIAVPVDGNWYYVKMTKL